LREGSAVYVAPSGELQLDVPIDGETVWLTQAQIADLFGVRVPTINEHLGNIYGEGELGRRATIRNFRIVRQEGRRTVQRNVGHYSLDAIISVGYRVNSKTATAFRQWATGVLRERLINAHRQRQVEQARWQALGGSSHTSRTGMKLALSWMLSGDTRIPGACYRSTTKIVYQIDRPLRPPKN
jgi:hypothetical protein